MTNPKANFMVLDRLTIMMAKLKVAADHPSWDYGIASRFKEICIRLRLVDALPVEWKVDNTPITIEMVQWLEDRMPRSQTRGRMYLWLISQGNNTGYDTFDSAVVVASTQEIARTVHPRHGVQNHGASEPHDLYDWTTPDLVIVKCVGIADRKYTKEGEIICASFNAG